MDEKKRFEDDLDIKWEMDLERDKKAREKIFGNTDDEDEIKLVNDRLPEKAIEDSLDKGDNEILKESLDEYEKDVLRSSQKDIYNKFGGDTETFEPTDDLDFDEHDMESKINTDRDSVSFYKEVPEYEEEIDLVPKKVVVTKEYEKKPYNMRVIALTTIILLLCILAALVAKINTLNNKYAKVNGNEMATNANDETIQLLTEKNRSLTNDIETLRKNIADMMASSGGEVVEASTEASTESTNEIVANITTTEPIATVIPTESIPTVKPAEKKTVVTQKPVEQKPIATQNNDIQKNANVKAVEENTNMTRAEAERNSVLDKDVKYTVVRGDSLIRLSKRFYGDAKLYTKIKEANGLTDEELYMGQKIIIPKK